MKEITRRMTALTDEMLAGFRAVIVNGPRQTGKSTLVAQVQKNRGQLVNLDDPVLLDAALNDPGGFLQQLGDAPAIDEFQRGGDRLLLALKMAVDASNERGQFLLAGSTRFLTTQRFSETLTGRVGIVEVLPLSAGEIRSVTETLVERAFGDDLDFLSLRCTRLKRADYADLIATGGFPELVLGSQTVRFRNAWCRSYIETVTALTNVEQVAHVRRPDLVANLLNQVAVRSAQEIVVSDLARELQVDESTIRSYIDILDTLYLTRSLPAWTTSTTNRAKRRGLGHVLDSALACHLVGVTGDQLSDIASIWMGPLLESYVVGELAKQASWADQSTRLLHYRDRDRREVDIVLERDRNIVGIEIKATSTPTAAHAKHLEFLRDRLGARFRLGIVLHTGNHKISLGDRLVALPVSALWA